MAWAGGAALSPRVRGARRPGGDAWGARVHRASGRALTLRCVAQAPELTRGASALRDLAFVHGSTDNISALVVDLTGV